MPRSRAWLGLGLGLGLGLESGFWFRVMQVRLVRAVAGGGARLVHGTQRSLEAVEVRPG